MPLQGYILTDQFLVLEDATSISSITSVWNWSQLSRSIIRPSEQPMID